MLECLKRNAHETKRKNVIDKMESTQHINKEEGQQQGFDEETKQKIKAYLEGINAKHQFHYVGAFVNGKGAVAQLTINL